MQNFNHKLLSMVFLLLASMKRFIELYPQKRENLNTAVGPLPELRHTFVQSVIHQVFWITVH